MFFIISVHEDSIEYY